MQRLVWITASSKEEALAIGRKLVEERLAACANVLPQATSVYWWNGAVEEGQEAVLVLKTRADRIDALTARVRDLHSYECPCVVALDITGGNPAFLAWLEAEATPRP